MSKWYEEAVFYHMYPLGMTGAPAQNSGEGIVHRLRELFSWIPHVREIGCTAIYMGPLFESGSHGYDTWDYKKVDRRLGDHEDFKEFVKLCHENEIRVVVDGVFNHTGREFFAFADIRKNRESSPYRWWYQDIDFGGNTHYNDGFSYRAWRNCYELANLNLYDEGIRQYLFEVIRFWIREFDIDGIRLDCADCLEFGFMKDIRKLTGAEKPDFWLMGEVIHGDYARWVNEELLHSVTNYELHKGLYSGHNDHNYFEIAHTIRRQFDEQGGIYRGRLLYSFVDNHDVDRIASKLNHPAHLTCVYTLLYTLPGIPSVYYGSEWGIEGKKEGPNDAPMRPCLDLAKMQAEPPHPELVPLLTKLSGLRRDSEILVRGVYKELYLRNRQYAFARILGDEAILTAVNNDDSSIVMEIPCPVPADSARDILSGRELPVEHGRICWEAEANKSAVFQLKRG